MVLWFYQAIKCFSSGVDVSRKFLIGWIWIDVCVSVCICDVSNRSMKTGCNRWRERIASSHAGTTRRTPQWVDPQNPNGNHRRVFCLFVCAYWFACVRQGLSNQGFIWTSFLFFWQKWRGWGRGREGAGGGGRSRRVRKKGFVPVNLYGRYFMPGCLSREKHLVQITGEKKLNHMLLLLLKSEISCLCLLLPAPPPPPFSPPCP